ncbi:hypothetical protein UlMin_043366 [Ulmus minor]
MKKSQSEAQLPPPAPAPRPLSKQMSWSPDAHRDEAWLRRKRSHRSGGLVRSKSFCSDDDLEELKACVDLGFRFDSPDIDPKLSDTLPALGLYMAVYQQYNNSLSRSSSTSSLASYSDGGSGSPSVIFEQGDDSETVKTKLRQWAQVVGCAIRESSPF